MQPFRFSLQKILQLKEYKEQQEKMNLGRITAKSNQLRAAIKDNEKKQLLNIMAKRNVIDQRILQINDIYLQGLRLSRQQLLNKLAENEQERQKVQDTYLKAYRQMKSYRLLREKQLKHYHKERETAALIAGDEQNMARQIRQRKENENG